MEVKLPQLIFGITLLLIWVALRFKTPRANPEAPLTLRGLQRELQIAEIRIALPTVGLLSISLSLS